MLSDDGRSFLCSRIGLCSLQNRSSIPEGELAFLGIFSFRGARVCRH